MAYKKILELPAVEIPGEHRRTLRTMFSPEQDPDLAGDFTMFHLILPPGSSSDYHMHERSGEVMYVMSGRGQGVLGDEVFDLEPEMAFYAPPGVWHQVRGGAEQMRLITLFSPAVGTAYARAKAAEG
ncbi:MAG: cupin domain-containing protein [Chloroflexota bacterium]